MPRIRLRHLLTACVVMWLAVATVSIAEDPPPRQSPSDTLAAADQHFNQAARERDRDAFRAALSPDVVFLAGEPQRGRIAVLAIWQHLFEGKFDFRYEAETLETTVAESGDIGWTIGTARTSFQRPGADTPEVIDGHYLNVWQHSAEDGWRLVHMASLVVHPTLGAAREPRSGMMTAWPELADQIGATIELDWRPTATVRAESGELAYTVGDYSASFTGSGESAEAIAGSGAFLSVWRQDAEGHWQLAGEGFTPPGIYGDDAGSR